MRERREPSPAELAAIQASLNRYVAAGLIEILAYDAATDEGSFRFHPAWFRLLQAGRHDLIERAFVGGGGDLIAARVSIERAVARLWPGPGAIPDRDE